MYASIRHFWRHCSSSSATADHDYASSGQTNNHIYSWLLYHQEPDIYLEHRSWHTTYSTVGIIITYTLDIYPTGIKLLLCSALA